MIRRSVAIRLLCVALMGVFLLAPTGGAQDAPRREQGGARARRPRRERGDQPRRNAWRRFGTDRMAQQVMQMIERGDPAVPGQDRWIERFLRNRLIKAPSLNALESAHYAVAEIHLKAGDHVKCLDRLKLVLTAAGDRQDEVVWLTHLNIASICRTHLGDVQRAIAEYKLVKGVWEAYAQRELLRTLVDIGKINEAVGILQKQHDDATEKGAKLALLKRIAEFYAQNDDDAKAIEFYDRIVASVTPAEIEEIKEAVRQYVSSQADKAIELRKADRHDAARRVMREVERRGAELRAQGRTDEFRAFEAAMTEATEKLKR